MKKWLFLFSVMLFFCIRAFSQTDTVWEYKGRLFVEKKADIYVLEWFHHKVEMKTDTLVYVKDSIFAGKQFTLNTKDQPYVTSNGGSKKLKLKIASDELLKRRKARKAYFLQYSKED